MRGRVEKRDLVAWTRPEEADAVFTKNRGFQADFLRGHGLVFSATLK